jgi:serine protease Do
MFLVFSPGVSDAQNGNNIAALQEIGHAFAGIAEQAYPGVVTIAVQRPLSSEDAIRDMLRERGSRSRLERGDLPAEQSESRRSRPSTPEDLLRRFRLQPARRSSRGLGVIVCAEGWIITNHHIVSDANSVEVELTDGRSFQGKIVGVDPETDIAVVKIEAADLQPLELGDSDEIRLGDWVIGIGNPMGIGRTFSVGLVTGKNRSGLGMASYEDFIQTDTAPTPGDGGGPLLDPQGRVIGINTAAVGREYGSGIGLAIPINMVKAVYEQLVETGVVERGFLGVLLQDLNKEMAKALGLEEVTGVTIAKVTEGSAAEEAGLRTADVIAEFNGQSISSSDQLRHAVAALSPGTQVEVIVIRGGERKSLKATLGQRPSAN